MSDIMVLAAKALESGASEMRQSAKTMDALDGAVLRRFAADWDGYAAEVLKAGHYLSALTAERDALRDALQAHMGEAEAPRVSALSVALAEVLIERDALQTEVKALKADLEAMAKWPGGEPPDAGGARE